MTHTRKPHTLQPNLASQRPTYVVFFDTETKPLAISPTENQQILKLGWVCFARMSENHYQRNPKWLFFTTKEEFWTFVEDVCKPNRKVYLVGHNVAFDFRIVEGFQHMKENRWMLTFFYNKGKTCLLTYRKNKRTIQVLDMTNFFPMSLAVVGKAVGLDKQEVDFATVSDSTLADYCKRDVEILVRAWHTWLSFLDTHDLGNFKHTLPSQAFNAYRHRFMPHRIYIHSNASVCELERASYRGGRTEVFWKGKREGVQFYQLDVNSQYAYVMQQKDYPTKLIQSREGMSVWKLSRCVNRSATIANVLIETKEPVFPVHTGTRNVYPIGVFETTLTTPELKYALAHNMVKRVNQVAWYRSHPIFREYSTYFAHLKEQYGRDDNQAFRTIAKLFGNALYGKFGQRGMSTKICKNVSQLEKCSEVIVEVMRIVKDPPLYGDDSSRESKRKLISRTLGRSYRLGGDFILEKVGGESFNSFPAIAAHVTAYARMYLWSLMLMAGRKNVFYCDTDCVVVNQGGYDNLKRLLDNHALGCLKVEKQASRLTIHAPKDYCLGDKERVKGIRKNALRITEGHYEQDQFLGLPGAIRRGNPDLVTIKRIRKRLSRQIKTGIVGPDGWVIPFELSPQ